MTKYNWCWVSRLASLLVVTSNALVAALVPRSLPEHGPAEEAGPQLGLAALEPPEGQDWADGLEDIRQSCDIRDIAGTHPDKNWEEAEGDGSVDIGDSVVTRGLSALTPLVGEGTECDQK